MARPQNSVITFEVTTETVRRGDVVAIGGYWFEITDLTVLPGQAKRLCFSSGESLTLHPRTRLTVQRLLRDR
ncbi:hypothetical protein [Streptomyces sp. NPDC046261]|uniref:hypothetical protein n=1 Tax=Streptomyces sp. NPDC046261 TaxID=3157200 RepID=UPI0033F0334D